MTYPVDAPPTPTRTSSSCGHGADDEEWHEVFRRFASKQILLVATEVATSRRLTRELLLRARTPAPQPCGLAADTRLVRGAVGPNARGRAVAASRPRRVGLDAARRITSDRANAVAWTLRRRARARHRRPRLHRLASGEAARSSLGADVTIVDSLIPEYGGNPYNIRATSPTAVHVNYSDIRDPWSIRYLVKVRTSSSTWPVRSATSTRCRIPQTDLDINCRSQLSLLEACREHNPEARVVFAGIRQQYGRPQFVPVTEEHPLDPGRRQRHQPRRGRALPPPLRRRVRHPGERRCA